MAYINPAPGTTSQVILKLDVAPAQGNLTIGASALPLPALQDITVNAANDVFTWSQLDTPAKLQIATTSTNSIACNAVVDKESFFGSNITAAQTDTVASQGVLGLSRNKTFVNFSLKFMEDSSADRFIKGQGYITGLAPTISADAPVWVTPVTITVSGEYLVSTSE